MTEIELPISKSIANRILILQALHHQPLMDVSDSRIPDDVKTLHRCLQAIEKGAEEVNVENCGTAMRFLTAYCAQLEGQNVVIKGNERMNKRPIIQEVDALLKCGADIWYEGEYGFPPLRIRGKKLHNPLDSSHHTITIKGPQSSQFVTAMMLTGFDVQTDCDSPYIQMTREVIRRFENGDLTIEKDWSSAAFWYEYVAIHGGELHLNGLTSESIQGDKILAHIYKHFGVGTSFDDTGVRISKVGRSKLWPLVLNFEQFPDLYPAIAITCKQLGKILFARHTAMLRLKESDRIESIKHLQPNGDHRIAMAMLAAHLPMRCDDIDYINKSYPTFHDQLCTLQSLSQKEE